MMHSRILALAVWLVLAPVACTPRSETDDDTGPAPVDTTSPLPADTAAPSPIDTATGPDASVATPPITPPSSAAPQDTPPAGAPSQNPGPAAQGGAVSQLEYEGWRQYSVNCARCHGQDVLPNPVAANLLISLAPGGPMESKEKFVQVVSEGRPDRGMPAFKTIQSRSQIEATYAYVKARADKRIPPGRPQPPAD
jgi:mono/diheme cytochrome c family protein